MRCDVIEPNDSTRRVLMIAHAFPPSGGSGVQRSAKFAKYLPQFGWKPTVWCAPTADELPRDEALMNELPCDLDRRTHDFVDTRRRSTFEFNHWRLQRLNRVLDGWSFPDAQIGWAKNSLPELLRIVQAERIDTIYSTHSPASNHWLAWRLKQATGLPWVADFRDLWTDNYDFAPPTVWHRRRVKRLEDAFLRGADAVIGVSHEQTSILSEHVPDQSDKFETIYNGADELDFASISRDALRLELGLHEDVFVVSFVGSFVQTAQAPTIVAGLSDFLRRNSNRKTEFRIVGWVPADVQRLILEAEIRISMTGYVSHADAIREMVAADCLVSGNLTVGKNCNTVVPAKIFEYQLAGHPIVHVGSTSSAVTRILDECGTGVTVPPTPESIAQAVEDVYKNRNVDRRQNRQLKKYTRRAQTGQLADILNRLSANSELTVPVGSAIE